MSQLRNCIILIRDHECLLIKIYPFTQILTPKTKAKLYLQAHLLKRLSRTHMPILKSDAERKLPQVYILTVEWICMRPSCSRSPDQVGRDCCAPKPEKNPQYLNCLGKIHQIIAAKHSMNIKWVPCENGQLAFFSPVTLTCSVPATSLQCNSLQRGGPWSGERGGMNHILPCTTGFQGFTLININ